MPQLSPKYLSRSCCRDSPVTCGLQTVNLVPSKHMGQKWTYLHSSKRDFYRYQDTPLYMCFLDAKRAFDRVNHWMLAKKLLDRNLPLHIVKLFVFWYSEQKFIVRWGNSLSMTLSSNGIRQGGQFPNCCIMYIQRT